MSDSRAEFEAWFATVHGEAPSSEWMLANLAEAARLEATKRGAWEAWQHRTPDLNGQPLARTRPIVGHLYREIDALKEDNAQLEAGASLYEGIASELKAEIARLRGAAPPVRLRQMLRQAATMIEGQLAGQYPERFAQFVDEARAAAEESEQADRIRATPVDLGHDGERVGRRDVGAAVKAPPSCTCGAVAARREEVARAYLDDPDLMCSSGNLAVRIVLDADPFENLEDAAGRVLGLARRPDGSVIWPPAQTSDSP